MAEVKAISEPSTATAASVTPRVWKRYDRPSRPAKAIILTLFGLLLATPIIGMVYFTFRSSTGGFTLDHWSELFSSEASYTLQSLEEGLVNSLVLTAATLIIEFIIVIPAIVLIDVRFPRLSGVMNIISLMPMAIPAIILVVGLAPVYSVISEIFGSGSWTLSFAYVVLCLPFIFTTIESELRGMRAQVLAEAAESLGAGWMRTLVSVLLPGIRKSLASASLITIAIVMGEFTLSSLLNRTTLQTALVVISQDDPYLSVIVTIIVLVLTFVGLFVVSGMGEKKKNHKE